ncbi:MAG: BACON domain-containing protein [Bryobacteraceae bacterium]
MRQIPRYFAKGLLALLFLLTPIAFAQPGPPVQYTDNRGNVLTLYPWAGQKVVFLTESNALDVPTMNTLLGGLDAAWGVYEQITGADPPPGLTFDGKDSIAEVPDADSCGAMCSYLDATGGEIGTTWFSEYVYNDMFTQGTFDQAPFYEFGRNFWFYHDQMAQIDPLVTGFAIANRFISMDRAGLPGGPYNGWLAYLDFENSDMVDLLNSYLADPTYTWQNTIIGQSGPVLNPSENPNGWGSADLAGAMFYRIYTDNGFDVYKKFWQTVPTLPQASTDNAAIANFIAAAATATGRDYSFLLKAPLMDQPDCTFSLDASGASFPIAGGTSSVAVTAPTGCTWIVSAWPGWVSITGGPAGTGNGSVAYQVTANAGAARSATLTIAGVPYTIDQTGSCTYSLNASGASLPAQTGSATIAVTAGAGCNWTVSGLPNWVTLTSGSSGTGPGTVTYQFAPHGSSGTRSATLSIAGVPFSLEQENGFIFGLIFAGSMPQIASAGGWETTLTLVNTTGADREAILTFFGNDGSADWLPFTFPQQPSQGTILGSTFDQTVTANGLLVLDTTGPSGQQPAVGSAQLVSSSGVGGFAIFKYTPSGQEAVVPLETRNASSYLLAFDNTGQLATGLAIANLAGNTANVGVIIRYSTGAQIGTGTISLPAQGHNSFMLTDSTYGFPITAGQRGTMEFDTPQGGLISVLGLRANGAALTTLPVLANAGTTGGTMAHVASGGGWQTAFTLVNTGTSSATATLKFFGDNGSALSLPLSVQSGAISNASSVSQTLAPGASLLVLASDSGTPDSVTGSAQLSTNGNVSGFAIFQNTAAGQEAVVPLDSTPASAYILAFDNTNELATGLALANTWNQPASVPVTVRDDTGAVLGTASIDLAADGHTSFMLTDDYAFTAGKRGTVEFDTPSGGQIAVLGLRATPAGAFTTIPVLAK